MGKIQISNSDTTTHATSGAYFRKLRFDSKFHIRRNMWVEMDHSKHIQAYWWSKTTQQTKRDFEIHWKFSL